MGIYASVLACCNAKRPKTSMGNPKTSMGKTWHFNNGTIVYGCSDIEECSKHMLDALISSPGQFWATIVIEGMYEVQFSRDIFPRVVGIVGATTGYEAGMLARHALEKDYKNAVIFLEHTITRDEQQCK